MGYVPLLTTAIILFVAAAAFLAAELFFPSHGLLGVFSGLFAVGGVVAMYFASAFMGAVSALALVVVAPVTLYYAIKYYPNSPVGKRVMLKAPPAEQVDAFKREQQDLRSLVGQRGVAVTLLRPAGAIEVAGRRLDCVSESEIIQQGTPVEIVSVSGMRIVVRAV